MDPVAVDREWQRGEKALCCGENVGCRRHLAPQGAVTRGRRGAHKRAGGGGGRHVEPVDVVVQHLHRRLGIQAKSWAVHKVHGGVGEQVALCHGQRDVRRGVPDGAGGVDT